VQFNAHRLHPCQRELILSITYTVVVFSIVVQGLTVKWLVKDMSDMPAEAVT
jgi:NhaP-type Na+/H+ or K+/H+ antiporter